MGEEEEARGEEGSPHQEGLEAIGQDKANKGTKETNPRLKSKGDAGPSSEKGRVPGEPHDWHCGISQDGLKSLKSKCGWVEVQERLNSLLMCSLEHYGQNSLRLWQLRRLPEQAQAV